jgi:DNA-directed RNA polymerase specialized sigma24 family protein
MRRGQRERVEQLYLQGNTAEEMSEKVGVSLDEVELYLQKWLSKGAPGANLTNP